MSAVATAPWRPLFVSDLDGTLLRPDGTLGPRTVRIVNELISAGGLFTYATARSFTSASRVTAGLNLDLPVITYGGAVIVDPRSGEPRQAATLPVEVVHAVQEATAGPGMAQPIMFATHAGRDRVCWLMERSTPFVESFLSRRRNDPRLFPLEAWTAIRPGAVFYISILGEREPLQELRDQLGAVLHQCHVVLAEDIYTPDEYWLVLTSLTGTKAAALNAVRGEVDATHLVCFGDNHNDLPLFALADVALAVANAVDEVRAAATSIIGTNAAEGVAAWLASNAAPLDRVSFGG